MVALKHHYLGTLSLRRNIDLNLIVQAGNQIGDRARERVLEMNLHTCDV